MRLTEHQIDILAFEIVRELVRAGLVETPSEPALEEHLRKAITADLRVEDELNDEVRQILDEYAREMKAGAVSYNEMFQKVKTKLARERKIVLG